MPKLREKRVPVKLDSYKIDFSEDEVDDPLINGKDNNNPKLWCPKCTSSDNNFLGLPINKLYCSKHNSSAQCHFPCSMNGCFKIFRSQECLNRHILLHQGKKPFQCPNCKNGFSTHIALKEHLLKHTNEKPYGCPFCDRFFRHTSSLHRHKTSHFGKLSKIYSCQLCDKSFTQSSYLKSHQLVHTQERTHACSQCTKIFLHRSDLKRHAKRHSSTKPYMCPACDSSFTDISNLRRHLKDRHKNLKTINKNTDSNENGLVSDTPETSSNQVILVANVDSSQINNPPSPKKDLSNKINSEMKNVSQRVDVFNVNLDFLQNETLDFSKCTDFKNEDYMNWLSNFTSLCHFLIPPIEYKLMTKITEVHKTIVDELSNPVTEAVCQENFITLCNAINLFQKVINDHLKYVAQCRAQ